MTTAELFRHNLARLMKRQKLTQLDMAAKMSSNQSYISHLVNGRRKPSFDKIDDLCAVLRCESREFFQLPRGKKK